jgi:threonine/homoserine/homoserine lactone efflux protein
VLRLPVVKGLAGALCALGWAALVLTVPLLSWAVRLLGVGYLLWLGYRLARFKSAPVTSGTLSRSTVVTFWQGAALRFNRFIKAWMLC